MVSTRLRQSTAITFAARLRGVSNDPHPVLTTRGVYPERVEGLALCTLIRVFHKCATLGTLGSLDKALKGDL